MLHGLLRRGMNGLAALGLSVATLALMAAAALAGEVVFPRGSVMGLEPPPGMVESTTFAGFEDGAHNASILMVDMPPQAYAQIEDGFSDAALASKGITVESRGPFTIPGAKGYLVTGTQTAGPFRVRKWILLAGTDLVTALVTVQVAETDAAALPDAEVRKALATLAFRSPQDQVAALPFTVTDLAGFRVVRTFGGSTVMLTDGPKNTIEGAEQPYFVVSVASGAPREDERRQFALRALSTLSGLKDMRLERAEPLRIAQLPGYEVMAQAVDAKTGEAVKIVQWLRFGQTGHIRMVGISKLDAFPELYPRFRAIRDGIDAR
ncbi:MULTISPECIES: hypothetical protein [unclassified Xanthobacter]|uniref:hypothetical protein n=1 Tax=unclassified Xanthobacter TaxID=2623496 RepID=UPI001F1BE3DD|nr:MULTISPECIES: hypothetical protein [unclassified Xanthobacter]